MKKTILGVVVIVFIFSGCTGSFNVTKELNRVHRTQENKWMDELIFLAFVIAPVYSIAIFGDAVIFNTVEFWSGKNPITVSMGESPEGDLILEKTDRGVVAREASGAVLYTSRKDSEGGVAIYDGKDMLVRYFSPEEVRSGNASSLMN